MSYGMSAGDIVPKGYKTGQLQQFTPDQIKLFKSLFSQLGPNSYLSKLAGGDEELFNEIERPAFRQFGELQGNLASRFSGMGLGARNSSGFQNAMTQAGSDLASQLSLQRQQLQQNALQELFGLSNTLLGQRPYERALVEKPQKQPSFLEQLALSSASGFSQAAGSAGMKAFMGG